MLMNHRKMRKDWPAALYKEIEKDTNRGDGTAWWNFPDEVYTVYMGKGEWLSNLSPLDRTLFLLLVIEAES